MQLLPSILLKDYGQYKWPQTKVSQDTKFLPQTCSKPWKLEISRCNVIFQKKTYGVRIQQLFLNVTGSFQ